MRAVNIDRYPWGAPQANALNGITTVCCVPSEYAVYLSPKVPNQPQWAAGWHLSAHYQRQKGWGGLHATLCGFGPKACTNAKGCHGSGLLPTLELLKERAGESTALSAASVAQSLILLFRSARISL
jgi:hypothetical protein